jgi:hypothetical protein
VLRFDGVADARITDHGDLVLMDVGRCVVAVFAASQWFSAYAFDEGKGSEDDRTSATDMSALINRAIAARTLLTNANATLYPQDSRRTVVHTAAVSRTYTLPPA